MDDNQADVMVGGVPLRSTIEHLRGLVLPALTDAALRAAVEYTLSQLEADVRVALQTQRHGAMGAPQPPLPDWVKKNWDESHSMSMHNPGPVLARGPQGSDFIPEGATMQAGPAIDTGIMHAANAAPQGPQGNNPPLVAPTPPAALSSAAAPMVPDWTPHMKPGTSDVVRCPYCLAGDPNCNADVHMGAMDIHMQRGDDNHKARYQTLYGVPLPPKASCNNPGCDRTFKPGEAHRIPDHQLCHGIEDYQKPHKLIDIATLGRMAHSTLNAKFQLIAQSENALKRRIMRAEERLRTLDPDYLSYHHLNLDPWSVSGRLEREPDGIAVIAHMQTNPNAGAGTPTKATNQYLATKLQMIRVDAARKDGVFLSGTQSGGYLDVARDLEAYVAVLELLAIAPPPVQQD